MTDDPLAGLQRLRTAEESGELAELCLRHSIRLLVAFGSAVREDTQPRDLDIAVDFEQGAAPDTLRLIDDLVRLTGTESIDLMDLRRAGPVAREQALVATLPLHESRPGTFARAQMAAISHRMETAWMRQLDLELMARR